MDNSKKIISIVEAARRDIDHRDDEISEKLNAGTFNPSDIEFWRGYSACATHDLKLLDRALSQLREVAYE